MWEITSLNSTRDLCRIFIKFHHISEGKQWLSGKAFISHLGSHVWAYCDHLKTPCQINIQYCHVTSGSSYFYLYIGGAGAVYVSTWCYFLGRLDLRLCWQRLYTNLYELWKHMMKLTVHEENNHFLGGLDEDTA